MTALNPAFGPRDDGPDEAADDAAHGPSRSAA